MRDNSISRFYWLDILRGIAALSVVLWHWQHFFFTATFNGMIGHTIDRSHYPLYSILRPFYGQGWRAVEMFFTLSGFVFFWLYSSKISRSEVGFVNYLKLRVSRLYPLHILTLFVVIAGQLCIHHKEGAYFIYDDYSIFSFFTNLTLTFNWFSSGFSFNGPVWSLSVEMLLYLIFFGFCTLKLSRWWYAALMVLLGYFLRGTIFDSVGTGLMSFFSGGIAFYLFTWQMDNLNSKKRILFAALVMPVVLAGAIVFRYALKIELPLYFFELVLFPLIIIAIALLEATLGSGIGKRMSFIGDISYSSYLWHFPLQIVFVLIADFTGKSRLIFYSPLTLLVFYILLITISFISFHFFERPVQHYLRKIWISKSVIKL